MLHALAVAVLCCAPAVEVRARVGNLDVVVALEGYREDPEMMKTYRSRYGERAVLCGSLGREGEVTISVIAERDNPHLPSGDWRRRLTREDAPPAGVEHFDCGEVACRVQTAGDAELAQVSYNAYPVLGGWCFDIHVSGLVMGGEEGAFTREAFLAVVKSFRAGYFRWGGSLEYPAEVLAVVHEAARRFPGDAAWVEAECKANPDDWARHFVLGMHLHSDAPPAALKAYLRALELLAKRKDLSPKESFVRMLAEEGAGLTLAATGKPRDGVVHLKAAYEAAAAAKSPLQGSFAYNLACGHALVPDAADAVKALREALDLDPSWRGRAAKDADFDKVRATKEFRDLVGAPPAGR